MPIPGAKYCGARCRTKNGEPCFQLSMKNGRCRMHGGVYTRTEKHGRETLNARTQRKQERLLLKELGDFNKEINNLLGKPDDQSNKK